MLIPQRMKRAVALCVVTAWASLSCIHLADALEDAKEGPESVDVLVAQALATPAEQSVSLPEEGFSAPILFYQHTRCPWCSRVADRIREPRSPGKRRPPTKG